VLGDGQGGVDVPAGAAAGEDEGGGWGLGDHCGMV
jgi:hypothetical protein